MILSSFLASQNITFENVLLLYAFFFLLPLSEEQKNNKHLLITIHSSIPSLKEVGLCVRIETKKEKKSKWFNLGKNTEQGLNSKNSKLSKTQLKTTSEKP